MNGKHVPTYSPPSLPTVNDVLAVQVVQRCGGVNGHRKHRVHAHLLRACVPKHPAYGEPVCICTVAFTTLIASAQPVRAFVGAPEKLQTKKQKLRVMVRKYCSPFLSDDLEQASPIRKLLYDVQVPVHHS